MLSLLKTCSSFSFTIKNRYFSLKFPPFWSGNDMLFVIIVPVRVSWQGVSRGYMHLCIVLIECSYKTIPFKSRYKDTGNVSFLRMLGYSYLFKYEGIIICIYVFAKILQKD